MQAGGASRCVRCLLPTRSSYLRFAEGIDVKKLCRMDSSVLQGSKRRCIYCVVCKVAWWLGWYGVA